MKEHTKIVYFLGIGGIGMSALARFYKEKGYQVFGYDLTETPLTDKLKEEGMSISFNDSIDSLPQEILENTNVDVIYTPAIPSDHPGFCYLKEQGFSLLKRAEALGKLTKDHHTIAIAGTHGKTTTTAMAAHILKESDLRVVSFVGGVMAGYESNFLMDDNPEWILVEADEFDRSFLQLHPDFLGITSVDADHLDIYNTEKELEKSFQELTSSVEKIDNVVLCDNIKAAFSADFFSYGFSESADIRLISKGYQKGLHTIEVHGLVTNPIEFKLPMPGNHNAMNAVLASTLCLKAGVEIAGIKESLATFKGIKRRFEYIIDDPKCIFIDDYAHHPKEIDALIDAVKQLYPEKKITGIFQPHLFSRTRDFAQEFARSLSRLDTLYLLDIYPAREKPIEGIDSSMLLSLVTLNEKSIVNKENLPGLISSTFPEILLTIGAGDIAQVVPLVKQAVISRIDHL